MPDDYGVSSLFANSPKFETFDDYMARQQEQQAMQNQGIQNRLAQMQMQDAQARQNSGLGNYAGQSGGGTGTPYQPMNALAAPQASASPASPQNMLNATVAASPPISLNAQGAPQPQNMLNAVYPSGEATMPPQGSPELRQAAGRAQGQQKQQQAALQTKLEQLTTIHAINPVMAVRAWNADPQLSGYGRMELTRSGEVRVGDRTIGYTVALPGGTYHFQPVKQQGANNPQARESDQAGGGVPAAKPKNMSNAPRRTSGARPPLSSFEG